MKKISNRNDLLTIFEGCKIVAEIGVFRGEYSQIINNTLTPSELHLIDKFEGVVCSGNKDGENIVWANLNEEYIRLKNWELDNSNIKVHKGLSYEIMEIFDENYFDMVYVDGDHDYIGVKKDLKVCFDKVKNGGFLVGHDYSSMFQGVVNAVDEFCAEYKQEILYITEDKCPTYAIKIKK